MSQWLVNFKFTLMQPHWLTVAGAAEALQPLSIAHLVPVSPVSSPKQAPDASVGQHKRCFSEYQLKPFVGTVLSGRCHGA